MNSKRKRKLIGIICFIILVGAAVGLILYALKQNINLFYTPSQLFAARVSPEQNVRIGGYVKQHSVHFDESGQTVTFIVTDRTTDIYVNYHGVLPNLFREGQVVVITGKINPQHIFTADQVLAKHDEKYMPLPLAKELKKGNSHAP